MSSPARRLTLLFLAASLLAGPARAAEEPPAPLAAHPDVAAAIALYEIWVGEQMAYRHQPGLSIAVVHGGELVWARGFGLADVAAGRPAGPDTVYRVGSITKTFTATALMLLRDEGKLRLDDPVRRHLPWLEYSNPFPDGPEITVWNLLTHTSGLPRESAFPYWTNRAFPTRDELRQALAGQEGLFEPGADYQYSNLAIALAGEVVAAASGESWAGFVRRRIFEPLGMTRSFAGPPPEGLPDLATGYLIRRPDGGQPLAPPTLARGLAPAADVSSTVRDLAKFVAAQLGGGGGAAAEPLLRAGTRREMQRVHWLSPSWSSGRGLGFSVWRHEGKTLVGHGGWVAGHRGQIAFDPKSGLGVVVLTNSDEGGPGAYVDEAFELIVPAIEKAVAPLDEPGPPPADAGRYAGAYHSPWGEVTRVLVRRGRLVAYDHSYPPTEDPEGSLTPLVPDGEHAFRTEAPPGRRGTPVVFELLEDGRVGRVKWGENYLYPAGCGAIDGDLRCTWE